MPIDSHLAGGRSRDQDQATARIAALQADLERLRSDRDDHIARLERQLALARTALPTERNAGAVASNLAAQQQIDALRLALQEKDRIIDELSATVRSMEDKLEDYYRNLDTLNHQLHQCDRQRTEAEDRAARAKRRLARARADNDERGGAADSTSMPTITPTSAPADPPGSRETVRKLSPAPAPRPPPAAQRRVPPRARHASTGTLLLAALLGAATVLAMTAALWWVGRWWPQPRSLSPASAVTMPATHSLPRPSGACHG